jgi:formylglycine-generating enzyme required for sulfatase activity
MHAVSRAEYMRWVDTLPAERRIWAKPLFRAATDGDGAINWVTYEQARAYCAAIGAKLPTSAQWEQMTPWTVGHGINPGGVRIWTATEAEGGAVVRGAFSEMQPDAIEREKPWTLIMPSEALHGGREPKESVASREIGIRCVQ